jgi:hypothetical protein
MLIYIAGPYRGEIDRNIAQARKIAIELWEMGHVAICPHLNTAHFETDCQATEDAYLTGDFSILARCDAIVMTPAWQASVGARGEWAYAQSLKMPIYEYPSLPPLHPTELRWPEQSRAFLEVVMRMYRVHLDKNADYSPANILGAGWIGLVTRLWDKTARLMNLSCFHLTVIESHLEQPHDPKNESIDDTLIDGAVYNIIGILLRRGMWGK